MATENPKLAGSKIIDCIPQTGECPMGCPECFYNGGRFYRTLDEPLIPTLKEALGKIVRVNSGHDSNIDTDAVLKATAHYDHAFFNTSFPCFDFPGPVVFTCNGKKATFIDECPPNLMFVRIRTNTWGLDVQDELVDWYAARGVPIVMTFMRYYDEAAIPEDCLPDYSWREHILNSYYCPTGRAQQRIMSAYKGEGVRMCGTPWSSLCVDCRNCEFLYWDCLRRMEAAR